MQGCWYMWNYSPQNILQATVVKSSNPDIYKCCGMHWCDQFFFFNIVKLIKWFIIRRKMTMKIFWTTQRLVGYLLAVHLKESSELKRMYSCTKRQELEIRWAFSEDKWLLQFAASEISTKIWTQILLTLQGKGWLFIILSEKVFDFPNTSNPCFEENAWDFWKWDFCCWQPVISCDHL